MGPERWKQGVLFGYVRWFAPRTLPGSDGRWRSPRDGTRWNEAAHVCAGPMPMSKKSAYGKVYTNYEDRLQAINNGKRNAHHRLKSANAVHNQFRHYEDSDRCACRALGLLYGVARGTRRAFRAAAPPLAGCAHTRRPWPSRRRSARPRRRHALGRVARPQRY